MSAWALVWALFFGWSVALGAGMEGMPPGLKPFCWLGVERPKAEALGYLDAWVKQVQRQEAGATTTAKANDNCRSFDCAARKERELLRSG